MRSFKYADERSRAAHLAELMFPMLDIMGQFNAIVPVPLHADKLRRRGYNQALLLATAIGAHLDVPVQQMLIRTRDTVSQVKLNRDERLANLTGAFSLDPHWAPAPGARLLLVDDVRTTGSTLNACASQLVRTGPRRIAVATLALDLPPRELGAWLEEYGL
ncbi:MAG: ComF family protein [Chloroflexia bacterium]|nr:ComF family protein [Chloroflexia bacterium]